MHVTKPSRLLSLSGCAEQLSINNRALENICSAHVDGVFLYNKTVAYSFKDLTKPHEIWTEDTTY